MIHGNPHAKHFPPQKVANLAEALDILLNTVSSLDYYVMQGGTLSEQARSVLCVLKACETILPLLSEALGHQELWRIRYEVKGGN